MPAAYAHLSFGRSVLRDLPAGKARALIQANPSLFDTLRVEIHQKSIQNLTVYIC